MEYAQLVDIDFTSPQMKQRRNEACVSSTCAPLAASQVESPSAAELNSLYEVLCKVGQPVALSLVPNYSEPFIPLCAKGVLPKPLTELYRKSYTTLPYHTLLEKCDEIYEAYYITSELAQSIEEMTRSQAKSKLWFQQRAGRVTASKLKAVISSATSQPSQSLIKAVCYPESACFKSKATSWGCTHEKEACAKY